jgi:hypothetical protein
LHFYPTFPLKIEIFSVIQDIISVLDCRDNGQTPWTGAQFVRVQHQCSSRTASRGSILSNKLNTFPGKIIGCFQMGGFPAQAFRG